MELLLLPDGVLAAVLARAAVDRGETVVRFACCSSLAAEAVRANRPVILAHCRAEWAARGERVLADSRALFADHPAESLRAREERHVYREWFHEWMEVDEAAAARRDVTVDFNFGDSRRGLMGYGNVLTALWLPVTADRVRIVVGGMSVIDLSGALIRALAPRGAKAVDVLPLTLGRGLPVALLTMHGIELQVDGACRVRASFASFASGSAAFDRFASRHNRWDRPVTCLSNMPPSPAILPRNEWHVLQPCSYVLYAIVVICDEDALDAVTVRTMAGDERTWDAALLRARQWRGREGVWQGLSHGFMVPIVTSHNFGCGGDTDVRVRLALRPGVDPAAATVTFATVEHNRMRIMGGMGGLAYAVL